MKAILVIDEIPNSCQGCDYDRYVEEFKHRYCVANPKNVKHLDEETDGDYYSERKKWCPLKSPPQINRKRLKDLKKWGWSEPEILQYETGFDDCLEEILGEQNETTSTN